MMENFWTSKKNIKGLRHFVLVNEMKEKGNITFLMHSVLDSEINLKKFLKLNKIIIKIKIIANINSITSQASFY